MTGTSEYNPLDYANLTKNCVEELMRRGPYGLELDSPFRGAGVYALFYRGDLGVYSKIRSPKAEWPIYVGKAVPPGARKGARSSGPSKSLFSRLREHKESISAAENLDVGDFLCRYLVVTPLWITMAERFLIEHYQPVWNVCLEGFGLHDPGKGRYNGERSWWDVLHAGRIWSDRLSSGRKTNQARQRVKAFLDSHRPGVLMPSLREDPSVYITDGEVGED